MMLWAAGRGPDHKSDDLDGFAYYLAHQLHMTVTEVLAMPHREYIRWAAYFTAKHAVETMRPVGAR